MKRGFVYGIGAYFAAAAVWFPTVPANRHALTELNRVAVAVELVLVVAAVIAFYAAVFLPPRRSWGHAWLGGVLGFFATAAALLALAVIFAGGSALLPRAPAPMSAPPCLSATDCR